MKKLLLIFVLIAYTSSTIGATISMHYCMGKLAAITIGKAKNDKCPKCGMKEKAAKKSCCGDKEHQLKLKAEHQKAESQFVKTFVAGEAEAIHSFYTHINPFVAVSKTANNYHPNSPPILSKYKLHVLYSVYLI